MRGLYASLLPLLVYAALGTSPALAVGPVSILSLLTAEAAQSLHAQRDHLVSPPGTAALVYGDR